MFKNGKLPMNLQCFSDSDVDPNEDPITEQDSED